MSPYSDLEEFSNSIFEDEKDLLEFSHQKFENCVFIWITWCKAFAPEMSDEISRALAVELLETIYKDLAPRVSAEVDFKAAGNILSGFIRRSSKPTSLDVLDKKE